jgi:hypothetical protein
MHELGKYYFLDFAKLDFMFELYLTRFVFYLLEARSKTFVKFSLEMGLIK